MKIAIAGASGFIGSGLKDFLINKGATVTSLKRGSDYDPIKGTIDLKCLQDIDILINLAGESIAQLWTASKKEKIKKSRVETTHLLSHALADLKQPPKLLINASAIGYYGNRGSECLTEESGKGEGFLSEVVEEWEKALNPALHLSGVRVIALRFGIVLAKSGGALARMITPFKWGFGGNLGDGSQYMSWIAIEDALGAIWHIINHEYIEGAINLVAPESVTNAEFTKTLAEIFHKSALLPIPSFAIKAIFGEMGTELFLSSTRVEPKKLIDSGYCFLYPTLGVALEHELEA